MSSDRLLCPDEVNKAPNWSIFDLESLALGQPLLVDPRECFAATCLSGEPLMLIADTVSPAPPPLLLETSVPVWHLEVEMCCTCRKLIVLLTLSAAAVNDPTRSVSSSDVRVSNPYPWRRSSCLSFAPRSFRKCSFSCKREHCHAMPTHQVADMHITAIYLNRQMFVGTTFFTLSFQPS